MILGIIFFILQLSAWSTLLGLVVFIIGIVQVIVDVGWMSMIKINGNLSSLREAYPIVARQRAQKIFLVPILFDISFVILSIGLFYYLNVLR